MCLAPGPFHPARLCHSEPRGALASGVNLSSGFEPALFYQISANELESNQRVGVNFMRTTDNEQAPALGPKIIKPEMPKPHQKVGNGVWKDPEGKLYTQIPEPPPAPTLYDLLMNASKP